MAALLAGANPGIIDEAAHVLPAGLAIAGLAHLYFFGLLRQLAPEIRTTVFVGVRMLMLLARIGVSPPCPYPLPPLPLPQTHIHSLISPHPHPHPASHPPAHPDSSTC